jgi:hypothetical protein
VAPRPFAFQYLIGPWLIEANAVANEWTMTHYNNVSDPNIWKTDWDNTPEDSLLKYAPFKLMAIVNRMDLKGNSGYTGSLNNAGETRFIYTLVAPFEINLAGVLANPGESPIGQPGPVDNPIDWQGMNVILEFGNPQTTRCDLRDYAQQWLDLSAYELGSPDYNQALEAITHTVIDANAAPNKPNGSALDQIRTNERLFATSSNAVQSAADWETSDWELSQFELNASSHLLVPAPVSNTPTATSNDAYNYNLNGTTQAASTILLLTDGNEANALMDWVTTHYPTPISSTDPNSHLMEKDIRQQLSLNTCQGCHSGETKTVFTQIRPVGYGQSQDYWSATPAYDYRVLDTRFVENTWNSKVNGTLEKDHVLPSSNTPQYFQRLSAFLTGRRYSGTQGQASWQDDDHSAQDDAHDNTDINTDNLILFQVYDPTDNHDGTTDNSLPKPDRTEGYNDLEMRKQKLCQLLNSPCNKEEMESSLTLALLGDINFSPLPFHGH